MAPTVLACREEEQRGALGREPRGPEQGIYRRTRPVPSTEKRPGVRGGEERGTRNEEEREIRAAAFFPSPSSPPPLTVWRQRRHRWQSSPPSAAVMRSPWPPCSQTNLTVEKRSAPSLRRFLGLHCPTGGCVEACQRASYEGVPPRPWTSSSLLLRRSCRSACVYALDRQEVRGSLSMKLRLILARFFTA